MCIKMVFFNFWSYLECYVRPLVKWFLRKTTRLCELQRICYGEKAGAPRSLAVERSLFLSRTENIINIVTHLDSLATKRTFIPRNFIEILDPSLSIIARTKKIHPKVHNAFIVSMRRSMEQIWSYKQLIEEVEALRKTQYDSENVNHEEKLLRLWSLLVPDEALESRVSKQWQYIGFQGDDPKTDFRGMGMLGLENLLYFATEYPQASRHALSHSRHPQYGYTYAIVGINLTSMAYYLLKDTSAKTYMYNSRRLPDINLFHKFYSYLFVQFDKHWIDSKPENIMEFSSIFKSFEELIRTELGNPANVFRINIKVDII